MWQRVNDEFDQKIWNQFVETHGPASGRFLQSWQWGVFQRFLGFPTDRWAVCDEDHLLAVATVMSHHVTGFGLYAYCPRGPVVTNNYERMTTELAKHYGRSFFFRCDPPTDVDEKGDWQKTISIQPEQTWMTNLSISQGELLDRTHKKTRYNIKLAERAGIEIHFDMHEVETVWPLFEQTATRGRFHLHNKTHYTRLLETIPFSFFATAWQDGRPIAANIMIDFAGVRTYLHGASSYEHRALMAPHLLHWELIKNAKAKGLRFYDWWGVSPIDQSHHSWSGISRFKRSFPGQDVIYPGTYDLVQKSFWYTLYQLARKMRRNMSS